MSQLRLSIIVLACTALLSGFILSRKAAPMADVTMPLNAELRGYAQGGVGRSSALLGKSREERVIAAEGGVDDDDPVAAALLLSETGSERRREREFLTATEMVAWHLRENATAPVLRLYTSSKVASPEQCLEFPDISALPKVSFAHKTKRKREVSPQGLLALLAGGNAGSDAVATGTENFTTYVSEEEFPGHATDRDRGDRSAAPWERLVARRSPVVTPILFEPPISFSDASLFNLSKPFGLWKSVFYHVAGLNGGGAAAASTGSTARVAPLAEISINDVMRKLKYPQLLHAQVPMFFTVFSGGAWVADGNVVTCQRAFTTGGCMWDFKTTGTTIKSTKRDPNADVLVAICDDWCNGFFHFTHEHLPRVALVAHILHQNPHARITIPPKNGFVLQYMRDVFGFAPEQLVSYRTARYAEHVVYPQPQKCGSIFTSTLFLLRKMVFSRLRLADPTRDSSIRRPRLLVALAERKKLSRMPRNYHDLIAELKARYEGVVEFRSALGLNVTEQIKLFHEADVAMGPHGANLSNILWMRHRAYVIEFISYSYANLCYYGTAARLGLKFGAVFHGATKGGPYNLSVAELARHIDLALTTTQ